MKGNDRQRLNACFAVVILATCVAAAGTIAAQRAPVPPEVRHAVVAAGNAESMQLALTDLSSAGLRVLLGSFDGVFFTRLQAPDQPGTYRAIRENSPDRLERALNAAGEQAFRLLPATLTRSDTATVAVAYRAAGTATPYRYRVLSADDGLERDIRQLAPTGFSIAGVFTQQSGLAATALGRPGRLQVVLEAANAVSSPATTPRDNQYRLVSALRASTVEKELNEAAAEGYWVVGGSFMNVLIEKVAAGVVGHSYRAIGAIRGETLQSEVEEAGRAGYRVVPTAIMGNPNSKAETVVVMERAPSTPQRYDYQWVSATRLATPGVLDDYTGAGFAPIALWRFSLAIPDEFGNRPQPAAASYSLLLQK